MDQPSTKGPEEMEAVLWEVQAIRDSVNGPTVLRRRVRRATLAFGFCLFVSLFFNILPWTLPSACAVCDSAEKVVPIAYGLILDSGRDEAGNYTFWPGGCEVGFINADRHCFGCGNEWHTLRAFGPLLILIFLVCCITVFTR